MTRVMKPEHMRDQFATVDWMARIYRALKGILELKFW